MLLCPHACLDRSFSLYADLPFVMHSDLNRLVMDYLVIEGYKSAAEEFSGEAGVITPVDFDSIESRMNIREALQRGDVQDAITRVNDLNPEVRAFLATFAPHSLLHMIILLHAPLSAPSGAVMIMQTPKLQSSI